MRPITLLDITHKKTHLISVISKTTEKLQNKKNQNFQIRLAINCPDFSTNRTVRTISHARLNGFLIFSASKKKTSQNFLCFNFKKA